MKMARTYEETIRLVTQNYLATLNFNALPTPEDIAGDILDEETNEISICNAGRSKKAQWKIPVSLFPQQVVDIMLTLYPIIRIGCTVEDNGYDLLAIYCDHGENEGIYMTDENIFYSIAKQYNYNANKHSLEQIIFLLKAQAPRREKCMDRDLVAVNNGILNYKTKTLQSFSPDYVFIAKSRVNYNPFATNVIIHNPDDNTDWDVESWMQELSDDPAIVNLLWEILGAIIRPYVSWNKSAWLFSCSGNSGKGTLCVLMRNLCGKGTYASIPLSDFSKEFTLEPLTHCTSIIVDENDVGLYIDKAATLKAVITNDVISLNRKFKTPIAFQFRGFMVQCLNEFPRIKDKSDSFYRRQLFVPFDKCFTGEERKYIKDDYLHRPEVLEYVLYRVLNMNYYELSEPDACKEVLEEFKSFNPVRAFMDELEPYFVWDLLPFSFLFELYKSWFKINEPSGKVLGKSSFITELLNVLKYYPNWSCPGRNKAIRSGHKMDKPEMLIVNYGLDSWLNSSYNGNDFKRLATVNPKATYNGLVRTSMVSTNNTLLDDDDTDDNLDDDTENTDE